MKLAHQICVFGVALISVTASAQTNTFPVPAHVSFAHVVTFPSPILYPQSIAAGDLNHDGRADFGVVGDEAGYLCIMINSPSRDPAWDCHEPAGDAGEQVIFSAVNEDDNLDEVTTDADLPLLTVGYGDGHGQFPSGQELDVQCGYATQQAAVADLNGDGIPDIVATVLGFADNPGCLAVFMGQGNGVFSSAQEISSGGKMPFSVAVGDLNHDGIPDLVVANFGIEEEGNFGNVSVLLGNGDGTFRKPVRYPGLHDPDQVILADFNGDGNLDVAVLAEARNAVYIALGKGDGTFSRVTTLPAGHGPVSVVAADFNGDGILDLAVSNVATPKPSFVSVFLGNGDGTFRNPVSFGVGVSPWQLVAADFNGDGKPDIATINGGDSTISILLNTTPWPSQRK
jgi:hypothetical protein